MTSKESTTSAKGLMIKLLLIGDSGAGKTALLMRHCSNTFSASRISTIGIDFRIKKMEIDGENIMLQIWDTAGQERFRTITQSYYRGANAILMVYDITDRQTFEGIKYWSSDISLKSDEAYIKILVGNKADLENFRMVSFEEGEKLANENGMIFFETSAKEGTGVNEMFTKVAKMVYKNKNKIAKTSSIKILPPENADINKRCC